MGDLLRTTDLDEARTVLSDRFAPHRTYVTKRRSKFDFRMRNNGLPSLQLSYLTVGADIEVVAPVPSYYVVCTAVEGRIRISSGHDSLVASGSSAVIVRPVGPAFFEDWSPDAQLLTVRLARDEMENLLATMLGRRFPGQIEFEPRMDLAAQGGSFLRALQYLRAELQRPAGMASDPLMAEALTRLVMVGLLREQPHNYSAELADPSDPALGPIRDAIELIESHPERVVFVADLAKAANLSVRALEAGFHRHVGMPPMAYLRDVRLARVHADLKAAEPRKTTAAAVARRWGFNHYGRFVAAYRTKYGTSPGYSLRAR